MRKTATIALSLGKRALVPLLIIMVVVLLFAMSNLQNQVRSYNKEMDTMAAEIKTLKSKTGHLEYNTDEARSLASDAYTRADEAHYIANEVQTENTEQQQQEESNDSDEEQGNNRRGWWGFFD